MNIAEKIIFLKQDFDAAYQKGIDKGRETEKQINKYYNLFVRDGLLYHMNFAFAEASEALLNSQAKYAPYVADKDERLLHPWWDGFQCNLGDGYLNFKGGANILVGAKENIEDGGDLNITSSKKISVEFVAKATEAGRSSFRAGLDTEFHYNANGAQFYRAGATMDPNSSFTSLTMGSPLNGFNINTYSITYGFNDATDNTKYALNMYGNGKNYRSQVIKSDFAGFSGQGSLTLTVGALNIYSVRVYERELSADEVLKNHFADIATINKLDISKFVNAHINTKAEIYQEFKNVSASDTGLQAKLDALLN